MTQDPFLRSVVERRNELDRMIPARQSPDWVARDIELAAASLKALTTAEADWIAFRAKLVHIAAVAYRAARDLQIESVADAAGRDIPF